jgi:hypothetical protein
MQTWGTENELPSQTTKTVKLVVSPVAAADLYRLRAFLDLDDQSRSG